MSERLVDVNTPLGDALWFRQMTGTEALSSLFEYDVTFHADKVGLKAKSMLGLGVTLKVETQDLGVRFFNGICTRFAEGGREGIHQVYTAKLRPWLWIAGRRSDCKIFQFKTVPEIIEEVLRPYNFPMRKMLSKPYRRWDYCVQYQETDLNFVMRLMEHEGIYFFFEHTSGVHTLVFADDASSHKAMPERPTVIYSGLDAATVEKEEHFDSWHIREEVDSGEYITDDYDFKHPSGDLKTRRAHPMGHANDAKERYVWPGGYVAHGEGDTYASLRMETLVAEQERAQGHCLLRTMATGYLYTLDKCPRTDQNREYLAVACTYFFRDNARLSAGSGDGDATWGITVTSQPTSIPYRPQVITPKPLTHGPQTAVVVGPAGEEIYTDDEGYGRVKVQFFWDRYGKKDENSSCWIRVSHPWAGDKWGFIHIPRIGQEVVVDFIGGDPDYPLITGSVYNAEKMPPYALPANKTASGIKSRSTKGGSPTDFNEIRMEDKKGEEQLYIHAQKNHDTVVELDESRTVGHDRLSRINHDDSRFVVNDDQEVIGANQGNQIQGNQSTAVKGNQDNSVGGNQSNMVSGSATQSIKVDLKEKTGGNHKESIGGAHTFAVSGDEKNNIFGNQVNSIMKNRKSVVVGKEVVTVTGKMSHFAAGGYNISTPLKMSTNCLTRKAMVLGEDETTVMLKQTNKVVLQRDTKIGLDDTTMVMGKQSTTVVGMSDLTAAMVTIKGGVVTITAGIINLNGMVNVMGMLNVVGPTMLTGATVVTGATIVVGNITATSYTPGPGNLV